jgi:protease I
LVLLTVDPSAAGAVGGAIVVSGPSRGPNARTTGQLKRTVLLETGRMVQNIRLQAAAQQLVTASVENIDSERVGELLGLSRSLEVQYILFVGPRNTALAPMTGTPTSAPVRAKRVVLVVSPVGFSDTEFLEIQRVLSLAGVETVVASTNRGPITAASGQVAESQIELENVTLGQIDALVYIGGPGIAVLATNKTALELAQGALRLNKLVGATGTAPTLLAQAGLLNGVRVAAAASEQNTLQAAGAQVTGNAVERDRQILTARGPDATTAFTRTLVNALVGR